MSYVLVKPVDALLEMMSIIFWDFDGVIKDSVTAKSKGFEQFFCFMGEK